jgi:two-component system, OmpR family, response regulator
MTPNGISPDGSAWCIAIGDCAFDPIKRVLRAEPQNVPLTPLESAALLCLGSRSGHPVSVSTLAREVWGHEAPSASGNYRQVIRTLRRKLERTNAAIRIVTVRTSGYALCTVDK